jgi:hypothetical protein
MFLCYADELEYHYIPMQNIRSKVMMFSSPNFKWKKRKVVYVVKPAWLNDPDLIFKDEF